MQTGCEFAVPFHIDTFATIHFCTLEWTGHDYFHALADMETAFIDALAEVRHLPSKEWRKPKFDFFVQRKLTVFSRECFKKLTQRHEKLEIYSLQISLSTNDRKNPPFRFRFCVEWYQNLTSTGSFCLAQNSS